MNKTIVIFDFDDVIVRGDFLLLANKCFGENKKIDELTSYFVEENFSITLEDRERYLDTLAKNNVYENATLIEGAYDTLKNLSEDERFEVLIASASILRGREKECARLFGDKYNFIIKELPFIDPNNIILGGNKSIFNADYLIDDRIENLISNKNVKNKILFSAYHNLEISVEELSSKNITRASGFDQIQKILLNSVA